MSRILACLAALTVAGVAAAGSSAYADHHRGPHRVFVIASAEITESSSLVVSSTHPGLVYTANDSGDGATVYVLARSSGAVVGHTTLAGVDAVDVEAMTSCGGGSLVVADIGDNSASRSSVAVYRLPEPSRGRREVGADRLALRYADGPHDAESVVCDTRSGRVFVVTKQAFGAAVYATAPVAFRRDRATLRPVAAAPSVATDATVLAGGRFAVIRTYVGAAIYRFPSWRAVRGFRLPQQRQGESLAVAPGGRALWVGSEGANSSVLAVPLPRALRARLQQPNASPTPATPSAEPPSSAAVPGQPATTESPAGAARSDRGFGRSSLATLGICSALAVAALLAWMLRRRHASKSVIRD